MKTSKKSGGSIMARLYVGESDLREANEKRIAIVNSRTRTNKVIDHFSHGGCGHRFGSKAPELGVRGTVRLVICSVKVSELSNINH